MAVTVNKAELAHRLGKSLPTLSRWIVRWGAEFPIISRGSNGRSYEFDAAAVFEFLQRKGEEEAQKIGEKDEELAQLVLPFAVPDAEDVPRGSSIKDQLDAVRLRKFMREEAERTRALVPAQAALEAFSTCFATLSRDAMAFIRRLGSEHNWPPAYMQDVERRFAETQRKSVKAVQEVLGDHPMEAPDERQRATG